MSWADRLEGAILERGNPCLVGLDPHAGLMPDEFAVCRDASAPRKQRARAFASFLIQILELVAGRVPAVKPQSAFFETLGAAGAQAWEEVVAEARRAGLLVIGDVKRGDIASTARAYAEAFLLGDGSSHCDAITVSPYLGSDTLEPFIETAYKAEGGIYVLVRTSNPGSGIFQEHGEPQLVLRVADEVCRLGSDIMGICGLSSVGAVVGATHPAELVRLRAAMPTTPFLIPGYGAQGAGAKEIVGGFLTGGRGALVNSSRGILYAHRRPEYEGVHWKDATRAAVDAMILEINAAVRAKA